MLELLEDNALLVCAIICMVVAVCILLAAIAVFRRNRRLRMQGAIPAGAMARSASSPALCSQTSHKNGSSPTSSLGTVNPFSALLVYSPQEKRLVEANGMVQEITGLSPNTLVHDFETLGYCLDLDSKHDLESAFEAWVGSGRSPQMEIEFPLKNDATNRTRMCALKASSDESNTRWLLEIRDIDDYFKTRSELQEKAMIAEENEKAKLRFLADMSHEIRTPMNGIMGTLSLARIHAADTVKVEEYLDQADNLTQYLLSIINNVLDISKIENNKMELEERCFSLTDVLARMEDLFSESTKNKGINYKVESDLDDIPFVVGDELRLVQVITNLVSNAQKFTPEGGSITVSLLHLQSTNNRMHFVIRVADTGKGMSQEFLKTIFDPFSQESSSTSRKFGGTGLGMAISDQMVRLMGGYIVVESEEGKGSTFEIYLGLPFADEAQIAEYKAEHSSDRSDDDAASDVDDLFKLEGSRILLAEDNMLNASIAEEMLQERGAVRVDVAGDGLIACELFQTSEPGTYDIILMDIQMPNMDGREAARTIRKMDHPEAQSIPIVALSADAYVEDKRASREAGMNGHISKPIIYEELERQICVELAASVRGGE